MRQRRFSVLLSVTDITVCDGSHLTIRKNINHALLSDDLADDEYFTTEYRNMACAIS